MSDAPILEAEIPATLTVNQPNALELTASKDKFTELANSIVITDQVSLERAAKFLLDNKTEQKRLDEERRGFVDPLNKVVKDLNAKYKPISDALTSAESIVKGKISKYTAEQERIQREAQAEAERKAEQQRQKLEVRAEKAEDKGDDHKAQSLRDTAATVVAAAPAPVIHKVAGISTRKVWTAKVTDPMKLCKLIADGVLPATLVEFKQAELNKIASQWQNNREFDGILITQETGIAAGRR